jgi:anti-sigma factor RsiW
MRVMTVCSEVEPRLSAFVDGALSDDERGAVAAHVSTCAACRGLVEDLERLRAAARSLGPVPPPDHIWLEVAGQIRLGERTAPASAPSAHRAPIWQWVGLAAALVVVTLGAYVVVRDQRPPAAPAAGSGTAATASVDTVAQELTLAMQHYDKAIAELQTLAQSNSGALDPAVAATLQQNLQVVDQAIAQSRAALASDPTSEPARDSLMDALRRKVTVLEATVALINEMRQGNQEGAARVAAGGGSSS